MNGEGRAAQGTPQVWMVTQVLLQVEELGHLGPGWWQPWVRVSVFTLSKPSLRT